jgi:lipopolysaccharide cholinephosphotransferase
MTEATRFLTLEEIKTEELNLLLKFDVLCKRRNLRYSLVGGTLLGAVRHKGFIPWDDDIDVGMPRPDFDRFIHCMQGGDAPEGTSLEYLSGDSESPVFVKFVNKSIFLKERYAGGINHLWLDVLPIDGMPTDPGKTHLLISKANRLRRLFALSRADVNDGKTTSKRVFKKLFVPVMKKFNCRKYLGHKLDTLSRAIPFGRTGFCGCVAWGLYGVGECYSDNAFDSMDEVEFEGHVFPAISCWDEYLKGIYGDYMQLPPKSERITHELEVWRCAKE